MNEKSKAFELIEFVWNNEKTDSYLRVNIAMYEAVKLAIISQMKSEELATQWCRDHPDATLEQAFMLSLIHILFLQ